jgi:hypothetical protein
MRILRRGSNCFLVVLIGFAVVNPPPLSTNVPIGTVSAVQVSPTRDTTPFPNDHAKSRRLELSDAGRSARSLLVATLSFVGLGR